MRTNPVSSDSTKRHVSHSVGRQSTVTTDKPTTSWDSIRPFKKAGYDPPERARSLITQTTGTGQLQTGTATSRSSSINHSATATDFFRRENGNILPPQFGRNKGKKTLVLDLDETLVHSSFQPVPNEDLVLPIELEGKLIKIYVMKRPGAKEFIVRMSETYEVVVYTASMSKYANPLLDKLDPGHHVSHRLFREHCTFLGTAFVKDLAQLGRDLKDVIIVDNAPVSYAFQPANAVPIRTWIDDKSDTQLYELIPILEILAKVHDVRDHLKKLVRNDQINCAQALKMLKAETDPQKAPSTEPRTTLINSWVPQQGRIMAQGTERTQQSQMLPKKDSTRYPQQEQSATARMAATYRPTRERVMYANASAVKHEPAEKTAMADVRRSVEVRKVIDIKDQRAVPSNPVHRSSAFPVRPSDRHEATSGSGKVQTGCSATCSGTASYGASNNATTARGKSCSTASAVNRSAIVKGSGNDGLTSTSTPSYTPGTPGPSAAKSRPSTSGSGARAAPATPPARYNRTPSARTSLGAPTATPITTSGMRTARNVSAEKGINPAAGRPTYYSNLLRTRNASEQRVDTQPSKEGNDMSEGSRTHSSLTAKHNKASCSVDREDKNGADSVKKELRFDTESSEINCEKHSSKSNSHPVTYSSGFISSSVNLMNLRKSAQVTQTKPGNECSIKKKAAAVTSTFAAKTASAGFYAWAPEKRQAAGKNASKDSNLSATMREHYSPQMAYLKERESTLSSSRPNLISRTGGVYIPYSTSRVGLVGYPNY